MDTKQLRQKILDLAIRGKLVPQDPNDEPASVLLERVKAEKERLIAEGKIKRSKKSAASSDKPHYPFEIPNTWVWTTLGELFFLQAGKNITADKINYEKNDVYRYPCYGGNGIRGYVVHYNKSGKYPIVGRQGALCGNLNYVEGKFYATEHAVPVETFAETIPYLAFLFLKQINLNQYATATAQPGLSVNKILDVPIPLPPKEEQVRIVQEVLKLEAIVESIETNKEELFESLSKVKSTVLEYAISGKLVPQNPADEPAVDLLKRVSPNAVVSTDTSHYALPTSWAWVKGKDLFLPMKSTRPTGHTFKYIDIDSIDNVNQCVSAIKVLPSDQAPSRASRFTEKNNILFSMVRPYLRNIAIVTEEGCIASTGFYVCRQRECLDHKYLYYLMTSKYVVDGLNSFMKGDNSPSINKGNVDEYVFPLPPLNEQKRIAAKVDELFAVIDQIQQSLE